MKDSERGMAAAINTWFRKKVDGAGGGGWEEGGKEKD